MNVDAFQLCQIYPLMVIVGMLCVRLVLVLVQLWNFMLLFHENCSLPMVACGVVNLSVEMTSKVAADCTTPTVPCSALCPQNFTCSTLSNFVKSYLIFKNFGCWKE